MVATRNMLLNKSDRWLQLYNSRYLPLKLKLKTRLEPGRLTAERQEISRRLAEVGQHFIMVCNTIGATLKYCEICYRSLPLVRRQDRQRMSSRDRRHFCFKKLILITQLFLLRLVLFFKPIDSSRIKPHCVFFKLKQLNKT